MATNVKVTSMPQVSADVDSLPPVDVDVTALPDFGITRIGPMGPMTLDGIPSSYTVSIDKLPDLNLRIKEIPSIRAHVPANFRLGLSLLGVELAALHLCGEAQIITEPYKPNPCERCGPSGLSAEPRQPVAAVLRLKEEG